MAAADIDIGAQGLTVRAYTTDKVQGSSNVLELAVEGHTDLVSIRLHFASIERLHAAVANLSGLSVQHRPVLVGFDQAKSDRAEALRIQGGAQL